MEGKGWDKKAKTEIRIKGKRTEINHSKTYSKTNKKNVAKSVNGGKLVKSQARTWMKRQKSSCAKSMKDELSLLFDK